MDLRTDPPRSQLTRKGRLTRARIVEAAATLMFERGVAATTIEAVQAAAQVSASQLYHYFADRDALVRAVIDHQTEIIVGHQESVDLGTIEGLRAWRDMLVELQRQLHFRGGCPLGSLGSQLAETDARARADVAGSFNRWEGAIRDGLRSMHGRGALTPDADPDALALATLASLQGGLLLTQLQRSARPLETALDVMIAHIESLTVPAPSA